MNLPSCRTLEVLDFSNGSQASHIPDDMFSSVSELSIKVVNFKGVNISYVNGKAFTVLKSLKILDVSNNLTKHAICTCVHVHVSSGLNETSIEEVYLSRTCLGVSRAIPQLVSNLKGTNLKVLDLDWNDIHDMGQSVIFDSLPNLKILTLTHNCVLDYLSFII